MKRRTFLKLPFLIITMYGCQGNRRLSPHIILDNSRSLQKETYQRILQLISRDIQEWTGNARTGDELTIWCFSEPKEPFPAKFHRFEMPVIKVPAYLHRQEIASDILGKIREILRDTPRVNWTPLLETIYFLSSNQDETKWELRVHSDLLQTSPRLSLTPDFVLKTDKEKVLEEMLKVCPPVKYPPSHIQVLTWPGLSTPTKGTFEIHDRLKDIFKSFFEKWAKGSTITIKAI